MGNKRTDGTAYDHTMPVLFTALFALCLSLHGWAATTRIVTNEAELADAIKVLDAGDVNILVAGKILLTKPAPYTVTPTRAVVLAGVTPDAEIDLNSHGRLTISGLVFHCKRIVVADLTLSNFQSQGAALSLRVAEGYEGETAAVVSGCTFRDIGTAVYPPTTWPITDAPDTIYTQVIGKYNHGLLVVDHCLFERCCTNQRPWSHAMYASAKTAVAIGNTYVDSGNPYALMSTAGQLVIVGDTFRGGAIENNRYKDWQFPWLHWKSDAVYVANTVKGRVRTIYSGFMLGVCDFNDFSECEPDFAFFEDVGGRPRTFAYWQEHTGRDAHSIAPKSQPSQ